MLPLSNTIDRKRPRLAKMFLRNLCARISALLSSLYGKKHAIFVNRSTTTQIELYYGLLGLEESLDAGSFTTNSLAMSCQGLLGISSGCSICKSFAWPGSPLGLSGYLALSSILG